MPYIKTTNCSKPFSDEETYMQYPTAMTSIEKVLERINEVGPSAYLVKQDWSDAYKHIHVSPGELIPTYVLIDIYR